MARVPLQTWATVGACCILWIALGTQIVPGARKHDFLNLYSGGSLVLDGNFRNLYDPDVQLTRERRYVPGLDALVPFVRPHFYALMLAPLALIPFAAAFWVWLALQTTLLIGCWRWAYLRWGPDALIWGALYLPTALGIAHGQDCVEMLVVLVAAYALADREKFTESGAVLGLGLIKFHLFVLWPFVLLFQRRWKMLAGFCATAAAELLISWMLGGTSGLIHYAKLLQKKDVEHLNPSPELTVSVHGLALNLGTSNLWLRGALVALVLVLVVLAVRHAPLWKVFAATAVGSVLVVPHVYGYDAGLLLLTVWLAVYLATRPAVRIAATAVATPIPFLMALAGKPWAATAPVALLLFLGTLAARETKVQKAS